MKPVPLLLIIALPFIFICGCSESPPAQPAVTPAVAPVSPSPVLPITFPTPVVTPSRIASVSDNTIIIEKNTFKPANMTVKINSTVRWVNADDRPHRLEFVDKAFSTSTYLLGTSQSASQRFDRAGTYDFSCTIHPEMQGTILVEV
ncbi:MAG: hypothetical protein EHM53_02040 [Methanoregulaceae archaeon]|nr:MAG: hypothetical protein EHM53_02040 [Methanoregulaceae archaeon]